MFVIISVYSVTEIDLKNIIFVAEFVFLAKFDFIRIYFICVLYFFMCSAQEISQNGTKIAKIAKTK